MKTHFSKKMHTSESLGLVMDWTHALNDNGELSEVLGSLMQLVKAEAALIVRISKADNKYRYVERCSMHSGKVWAAQPRSHAQLVMGESLSTAKAGLIWKLSDGTLTDFDTSPLVSNAKPDNLVELIVVPLESATGYTDILELHFRQMPLQHDLELIMTLIGTLTVGWIRRSPGSITKKLNKVQKFLIVDANDNSHISILDTGNPAQLSRCEFRVCSLLKEGMTVNVIADTLSIGPATVRSHLSSIFSKTDASNQVELLHLLNKMTTPSRGVQSIG